MASSVQSRSIRIHTSDRGQSIDIPSEFALSGEKATISKDMQGRLIVEPLKTKSISSLVELIQSWEPLGEEDAMPEIEDLPPEPVTF